MSNQTTNTFQEGLMMDLNPLITPSNVMTNCLNGTLITYNGNENVLQNDMGNGRVETAFLPEGYIPLGTCELGGIIYIVSYNPIIKQCQIGSFPSPERNIMLDELVNTPNNATINYIDDFASGTIYKDEDSYQTLIKQPLKRIVLLDKKLYPGDLFKIYSNKLPDGILSAHGNSEHSPNKDPRYLKLNIVSIEDDGTITNLNDSMVWNDNNYYIAEEKAQNYKDLDEYRKLVGGGYTPFTSKTSGKLGILAQLEAITNFDCAWDAEKDNNGWKLKFFTNWEYENDDPDSKGLINLSRIKVVVKTEETDKSDSESNNESEYFSKALIENDLKGRKNDGSDDQTEIKTFDNDLLLEKSGIYTIDVYPVMPFGTLEYLKKTFTIDTSKLGTGTIDLKEYRYYYNDKSETVILNWGFDIYAEKHKQVKAVTFDFYDYSQKEVRSWVDDNGANIQADSIEYNKSENITRASNYSLLINQSSYNGNFVNTLYLNVENENKQKLEKYKVYLVKITIKYGNGKIDDSKSKVYYRFMYTTDIFNSQYNNELDFKEIELSKILFKDMTYKFNSCPDILKINSKLYKNDKEQDLIPSFEVLEENKTEQYKVTNTYSFNTSPEIKVFSSFKKINIEADYSIENVTISHNSKYEQSILNLNNNPIDEKTTGEIDFKLLPQNQLEIYIPITAVYNRKESKNFQYELVPLSKTTYGMWTYHNDKNSQVRLVPEVGDTAAIDVINLATDEHVIYSHIFNSIFSEDFKEYDVIELITYTGSKNNNGLNFQQSLTIKGNNGQCLCSGGTKVQNFPIYILKNGTSNIATVWGNINNYYKSASAETSQNYYDQRFGKYYKIINFSGENFLSGRSCYLIYYPDFVLNLSAQANDQTFIPNVCLNDTQIVPIKGIKNLNIEEYKFTNLKDIINIPISILNYIQDTINQDWTRLIKTPSGSFETDLDVQSLYVEIESDYVTASIDQLTAKVQNNILTVQKSPNKKGYYRSEEDMGDKKHQTFELTVYNIGK